VTFKRRQARARRAVALTGGLTHERADAIVRRSRSARDEQRAAAERIRITAGPNAIPDVELEAMYRDLGGES